VISVVYILGTGSVMRNFEIRMSLRSIEKNLTGVKGVWLIGECPEWIQNVNHIPFPDKLGVPSDFNIMSKVTRACEEKEISEDFLFINDDHYLLKPFNAPEFPYFYEVTLEKYLQRRPSDTYAIRAKNTLKYLKANNLPVKHFDIHYPIIYNKSLFLKHVTNAVTWGKDCYIIKSMYANSLFIEGVEAVDYKISRSLPPEDAQAFSTTPRFRHNVQRFLLQNFKKQSRFEKTGI
jgi:hypothetical protein